MDKKENNEVDRLKIKIKKLEIKIAKQAYLIKQYRENYLMNMFNTIQAVINEYSTLLNPEPIRIKSSFKGKGEYFDITVNNILFIKGGLRYKTIYFKEPIKSYGGDDERTTYSLTVMRNWEQLIKEFDRINLRLFQVNRDTFVNVKYYSLSGDDVTTRTKLQPGLVGFNNIKISKSFKERFCERRENYLKVVRLRELLIDYNLKNGIPQ